MIFHICGTMCAGKTTVIERIKRLRSIRHWDIKDFYHQHGIHAKAKETEHLARYVR